MKTLQLHNSLTPDNIKGKHFRTKFIQPGLVKYADKGVFLVKKEIIDKMLPYYIGAPVAIDHGDITPENVDEKRSGVVSSAEFNEFDGWYWADGILFDKKAIDFVQNGGNVSCTIDDLEVKEGGVYNGFAYDYELVNGRFKYLALVENPRYTGAEIILDNKIEFEEKDHPRDEDGKFASENGENSLKADSENFKKEYFKLKENPDKTGKQLKVLSKPSKCWTEAGLPNKEIIIPYSVIKKITKEKRQINSEIIGKLPELISDPLYIFESSTQKGSFVGVLNALEDNNKPNEPLIAAIKPIGTKFEINIITSAYSKDGGFIEREIGKGKLKYQKNNEINNGASFTPASIAAEGTDPITSIINFIEDNFNPNNNKILDNGGKKSMKLSEALKKVGAFLNNEAEKQEKDIRATIKEKLENEVDEETLEKLLSALEDEKKIDNEEDDEKKDEKKVDDKEGEKKDEKIDNKDEEEKKVDEKKELDNALSAIEKALMSKSENAPAVDTRKSRFEKGSEY